MIYFGETIIHPTAVSILPSNLQEDSFRREAENIVFVVYAEEIRISSSFIYKVHLQLM